MFAVVLLFGGWGIWQALKPASVGGPLFSQLPPQKQAERRVEAEKVTKQVEELARASKNNEHKPFSLEISQDQLNTLLQDNLKTQKFPIRDLRAGLEPKQLTLQGTANYQGFDVPVTLKGDLQAQNGGIKFQVESLQLSNFPAPDKWKTKIETAVAENFGKLLRDGKNGRVKRVSVEAQKIIIEGITG